MKKEKIFGLLLIVLSFALISCGEDNEEQYTASTAKTHIDENDLYGTWIVKGNSPIVALIDFKNNGTSYLGYNYSGVYGVVEYVMDGISYKFHGRFWGGFNYRGDGVLEIGKPTECYSSLEIKSRVTYDDVRTYPIIYPSVNISSLSSDAVSLQIGERRFIGTKNDEYTSSMNGSVYVQKEFADLGLSVCWAKCNIGASTADGSGKYYGWGEVTGNKTSTNNDYYPTPTSTLPKTIIKTKYDIAKSVWGGEWRMPSYEELQELMLGCIDEDVTYNGTKGVKYTGITGNSIFLPCAGYRDGDEFKGINSFMRYWTGDLYPYSYKFAWGHSSGDIGGWYIERHIGGSVRAVIDNR